MERERFYSENMEPDNEETSNNTHVMMEIKEEFFRSGGKGGQNVNKVETGVRLRIVISDPQLLERLREIYPSSVTKNGEFLVVSTEERTQEQNLRIAHQRLQRKLEVALKRPEERIATKVPYSSKQERLSAKKHASHKKELRKRVEE